MASEVVNPQSLCQIEIVVRDLQKSMTFYANVMGWQRVPAEIHDYAVLQVPEDCPFGISLVPGKTTSEERLASRATLYFRVQDPQAISDRAREFGGQVIFGPKKLPGYGVAFQIADPDGQRLGLFSKL